MDFCSMNTIVRFFSVTSELLAGQQNKWFNFPTLVAVWQRLQIEYRLCSEKKEQNIATSGNLQFWALLHLQLNPQAAISWFQVWTACKMNILVNFDQAFGKRRKCCAYRPNYSTECQTHSSICLNTIRNVISRIQRRPRSILMTFKWRFVEINWFCIF